MKFRNWIFLSGLLVAIFTGCKEQGSVESSKGSDQQEVVEEDKESEGEQEEVESSQETTSAEEAIVVTSEEVQAMIEQKEQAYVAIGDFDSEEYALLLENMKSVCAEKGVPVYTMNSKDDQNAKWLEEQQVQAALNIAFLSFGSREVAIFDMKSKYDYQDVPVLKEILDGVSGALESE